MSDLRLDPAKAEAALARLLVRYGAGQDEAAEVSEHLVQSDLQGHGSHGLIRAPWYIGKIEAGEIVCRASISVENETPTSAVLDGGWGFGQPACRRAMELALDKAEKSVVACVTVRNANHVGRLGAYTSLAPARGMIAIAMANLHGTSHCVAPFGGIDRRLPTNPLSIAAPKGSDPAFLLDMTTSIVAEGKLKVKLNRRENLPDGWAIDADGRPATRPEQFYEEPKGAILPLGGLVGYKGYGLSLAVDALSGGLSGAQCSNPTAKRHGNACLFLALRVDAFRPLAEFRECVDELVAHVKSSRPAAGGAGVRIPGEPERESAERLGRDGLPLDSATWSQLLEKARAKGAEAEFLSILR